MKRIQILCFMIWAVSSFAQKEFPDYQEVVNEFFTVYKLDDENGYKNMRFVKSPDGYSVEFYDFHINSFSNSQLLWSLKKEQYLNLKLSNAYKINEKAINYFQNDWNADKFDLYPYYGYTGWEFDVVNLLESYWDLNDDQLYALGRSYSSLANNLLNSNFGFADSLLMFELTGTGKNQLDNNQLEKYRFFAHSACRAFDSLCIKNPEYETVIGSICNKAHNEYVTSFLNLWIYQNYEEAFKELPDGIYSDLYKNAAKAYLESCDSNAILFTFGDNDTYPLLYLQAKENFRRDVLVINLSLLNNNNYINHLREGNIFDSEGVDMILSPETYEGEKLSYAFVADYSKDSLLSIKKALTLIEENSPEAFIAMDYTLKLIPSKKLEIVSKNGGSIKLHHSSNYILKGDLIALDIIQSNINERPIYFLYEKSLGLQDYFQVEGLAYKLISKKFDAMNDSVSIMIDAVKTFNLLKSAQIDEKDLTGAKAEKIILRTYQSSFNQLADYYAKGNQLDSCKVVILMYLELLPNDMLEKDYGAFTIIKAALNIGEYELALNICEDIIDNIERTLKENPNENSKQAAIYIAYELHKIIEGQSKILQDRIQVILGL